MRSLLQFENIDINDVEQLVCAFKHSESSNFSGFSFFVAVNISIATETCSCTLWYKTSSITHGGHNCCIIAHVHVLCDVHLRVHVHVHVCMFIHVIYINVRSYIHMNKVQTIELRPYI